MLQEPLKWLFKYRAEGFSRLHLKQLNPSPLNVIRIPIPFFNHFQCKGLKPLSLQ